MSSRSSKAQKKKKKKEGRPPEAVPIVKIAEDGPEAAVLEADYQRAAFGGKVTTLPPDPEHGLALVAQMSEQGVRDMLTTTFGSKTAVWRPDAENRAFLAQLLGSMSFDSYPIEEPEKV